MLFISYRFLKTLSPHCFYYISRHRWFTPPRRRRRNRTVTPPAQVRGAITNSTSVYRAPPPSPVRGRVPRSHRRPYRPGPAFVSVSASRTGVAAVARRRSALGAATSRRATVAAKGRRDAVATFRRATENDDARLSWWVPTLSIFSLLYKNRIYWL